MSYWLYATCLVWYGADGIAKLRGTEVALVAKPVITGLEFDSIKYVPEIDWRVVQVAGARERQLDAEEVRLVDRWLYETFKG